MRALGFTKAESGLRTVAGLSVLARMPTGMAALTIPLLALGTGHGVLTAGLGVAGYRAGQGLAGPAWARITDRAGLSRALAGGAVAFAVATTALLWVPGPGFAFVAAVAGLATLPFGGLMRAFWTRQHDLTELQAEANAFESFLTEAVLLTARVLVAVLALALGIRWIVAVQALMALGGGLALAATRRIRVDHRRERRIFPAGPKPLNPIRRELLALLLTAASLGGFAFSLVVRLAQVEHGETWTALSIAAWGLGSLAGISMLNTRVARHPRRSAVRLLAAMAVVQLASLPAHAPWLVMSGAFAAGLPIAAAVSALYHLLGQLSDPLRHNTVFAWATTMTLVGDSSGSAAASVAASLVGRPSATLPIAAALAALAVGALLAIDPRQSGPPGYGTTDLHSSRP
jgi:MFS family permease